MNCYYSNLNEGHNTHPIDIERALRNEYSDDKAKRDLQLEAKAHIAVQEWIDGGALRAHASVNAEAIAEIHPRFCEMLPEDLLHVERPIADPNVGTTLNVYTRVLDGRCGRPSRSSAANCSRLFTDQVRVSAVSCWKIMVRPPRLDLATSWFVG